jgi:hypothetical protein
MKSSFLIRLITIALSFSLMIFAKSSFTTSLDEKEYEYGLRPLEGFTSSRLPPYTWGEVMDITDQIRKGVIDLFPNKFPEHNELYIKNSNLVDVYLSLLFNVVEGSLRRSHPAIHVIDLNLSGNNFTNEALPYLRQIAELPNLFIARLNLSYNQLGGRQDKSHEAYRELSDLLNIFDKKRYNQPQINLSYNNIEEESCRLIVEEAQKLNITLILESQRPAQSQQTVEEIVGDGLSNQLVLVSLQAEPTPSSQHDQTTEIREVMVNELYSILELAPSTSSTSSSSGQLSGRTKLRRVQLDQKYESLVQTAYHGARTAEPELVEATEKLVKKLLLVPPKEPKPKTRLKYSPDEEDLIRKKIQIYKYAFPERPNFIYEAYRVVRSMMERGDADYKKPIQSCPNKYLRIANRGKIERMMKEEKRRREEEILSIAQALEGAYDD